MCLTVYMLGAATLGFGHQTDLALLLSFCFVPRTVCCVPFCFVPCALCCVLCRAVPRWMMRMLIKSAIGPIFPYIRATPLIVWFYR